MMDEPQIDVARVLPQGGAGALTPAEAEAILEIAYLATQADGRIDDEEAAALRDLAGALGGAPKGSAEMNALLDRFAASAAKVELEQRLASLAGALGRPVARDTAYKVAFAMALCDLADNDDEDAFDDALVAALGLGEEAADELAAQVYEAIGGDEEGAP